MRDRHTLLAQRTRALAVVNGDKPAKKVRFVKITGQQASLDEALLQRAEGLGGLKGYVTNITAAVMPAAEVIASYAHHPARCPGSRLEGVEPWRTSVPRDASPPVTPRIGKTFEFRGDQGAARGFHHAVE